MVFSDLTCAPSSEMHSAPKTMVHTLATVGPISRAPPKPCGARFPGAPRSLYGAESPGLGPF